MILRLCLLIYLAAGVTAAAGIGLMALYGSTVGGIPELPLR